jgi:hypothetical protein
VRIYTFTLLQKRFMVTPRIFEWCRQVTVAHTQNNRYGTRTRSQPAQKMESIIDASCLSGPAPKINF